jgi:hypothetical protein
LPTVTTQSATGNTSGTSATLNGDVTSIGLATVTLEGFVYDTSSHSLPGNVAPGSSGYASNVSTSGSFGVGTFSNGISGLTIGTTYWYRSVAQNSVGYSYGNEVSFTTPSIFLVQEALAYLPNPGSNTENFGLLFPSPNQAHDLLVCFVFLSINSSAFLGGWTPVDNLGNNWQLACYAGEVSMWYVENCIGGVNRVNVANAGIGLGGYALSLYEFSGVAYTSALNQTGVNSGGCTSVTPSVDRELVVTEYWAQGTGGPPAITIAGAGGWNAGNGWSMSGFFNSIQDAFVQQATAAYIDNCSWTISPSPFAKASVMASFLPASGAPPAPTVVNAILPGLNQFGVGV